MLTLAAWFIASLSTCAPVVFVDQIEDGVASVISLQSGAAWTMRADGLPTGTTEGDEVNLCGYHVTRSDDAGAIRARLGASDPVGDIDLLSPQTFNGGPVPFERRGL